MTDKINRIDSQELINSRLSHKQLQTVCHKLLQRVEELEDWTEMYSHPSRHARDRGDSIQDTMRDWSRKLTEEVAMESLNVKPKFKVGTIVNIPFEKHGNDFVVSRVSYSTLYSRYLYLLHNVKSGNERTDIYEGNLRKKRSTSTTTTKTNKKKKGK